MVARKVGTMKLGDIEYDDSDLTDEEWACFVAGGLADELIDPREDIYSVDDGEPIHCHNNKGN
jgi:hypothetical protein